MTEVLFVHGTGVREPRFTELFTRFTDTLRDHAPSVRTTPYHWGAELGSRLAAGGLSLPPDGGDSRGGTVSAADDDGTADWSLLYADPHAELALAAAGGGGGELPPGAPLPSERPRRLLAGLPARLDAVARDLGVPVGPLRDALDELTRGRLPARAAAAAPDDAELALLLARCLVASAVAAALAEDSPVLPDGAARDTAVAALVTAMAAKPPGSDRGPLARLAARPVVRLASWQAVRRRRALTGAAHPAAADVMLFLARGEPLRRRLRELVAGLEPPVVVVGHSLGGIIALDTLIRTPLPQVELLVTVGSQGPFLYESGALPALAHPDPLPAHMPRWLNVYDRRDLLSYLAAPLFPGRATDVEVDNRQPFPASHSAYWSNPAVYRALAERLP
ncbi:alpha/beta fold hydrolase [Streptomyces sp. NPDC056600]|uniref:alpha/beta fold hydrolase n=1 Tax=Streptomyces sp. NPDC056600 TaxID=3345874 RepID=UPI0036A97737